MDEIYLWVKVFHLVFVVAWMAGMLYLPRLFAYHATLLATNQPAEIFKVMERRLLKVIINPAMLLTWVLGFTLVWLGQHWHESWIYVKLALVMGLQLMHIFCIRWQRDFAHDRNRHNPRFYKLVNEIPTLLLIGIVICAVFKFS